MESNNIPPDNTWLNISLTFISSFLGYISINFTDKLKDIDLLLSPIVKLCSLASFVIFIILNYTNIKTKLKSNIKKYLKIKVKIKKK